MNYYIKNIIIPFLIWACLHVNHQQSHLAPSIFVQAAPPMTATESASDGNSNDVERYINNGATQQHPTKGLNKFRSRNEKCRFSYCERKRARCSGLQSCCWCQCKPGYTFFSYEKGCLAAPKINSINEDEQCTIFSKSVTQQTIPLFTSPQPTSYVELTHDEYFPIHENVTCYAGAVHYYAYVHGSNHLLDHNDCEQTMQIWVDKKSRLMFKFGSEAQNKWENMAGLLISTEVHCETTDFEYFSSCFMFQIAGDASEKLRPGPSSAPNYTCPAVIIPTEIPVIAGKDTIGAGTNKGGDDINKGIIIGAVVVCLLIICCVVAVVFFIRRRKIKAKNEQNTLFAAYNRPEVQTNDYENHQDLKLMKKKKNKRDSKSSLKKLADDENDVLYVDVPQEVEEYASIDGEGDHEYEQPIRVLEGGNYPIQRNSNGYKGGVVKDPMMFGGRSLEGGPGRYGAEDNVFNRNSDVIAPPSHVALGRNGSIRRDGTLGRNGSFRRNPSLARNDSFRTEGSLRRDGTLGRNGSVAGGCSCDCSLRRDGTLGSAYDGGSLRRDGTLKRGSGGFDMSKRPLPECPQAENPYYASQSKDPNQDNDNLRQSEDNELYSLYSTINDLKPTT